MLKIELLGMAVTLTIIWFSAMITALTEAGRPPTGLVAILCTIITASAWFAIWTRRVRKELQDVRDEVRNLREERDVSEAMRQIRHLRVVEHESDRGDSHG